MRNFLRRHYHWVIALVMTLHMGIYTGLGNNSGLFILPVTGELGINRSTFSLVMSLRSLCGFLAILFSGPLVKRFGYRRLMFVSLPLAALGYFLFSRSGGVVGLLFGAIFVGISLGYSGSTSVSRVVSDWFHRHRGAVLGVVSASSGVGGSLCCLALSSAMAGSGWRSAYLLCTVLMLFLLVLNGLFVRNKPEDMGLRPYGEGEISEKHRRFMPENTLQGYSFQELSRRPVFYLMIAALLATYIGIYIPYNAIVPHLRDCGLTAEQAVEMQSTMLLVLSISKILMGLLMDLIGVRWVTLLCFAFGVGSMAVLPAITGPGTALTAILLYSFALPITSITLPLLTIDLFGYHSYAIALGVFSSITSIGSMIASPLSGSVFDAAGSYAPAFRVGAAIMAAMIAAYLLLYRLADREKARWLASRGNKTA